MVVYIIIESLEGRTSVTITDASNPLLLVLQLQLLKLFSQAIMPTSKSPAAHDEYAESIPLIGAEDLDEQSTPLQPRNSTNSSCHSNSSDLTSRFFSALVTSALFISLISFFWSGAQLLSYTRPATLHRLDVAALRHPSLYNGLDRVPRIKAGMHSGGSPTSTTSYPSTTHFSLYPGEPQQIVRINSDYPNTAYPEDPWVLLSAKVVSRLCSSHTLCLIKHFLYSRISFS
jgi:hypothetical protein